MRVFPILLLAVFCAPIQAAETPWQDLAPGVRMRLITTGEIRPDGRVLAALEIDMPESTKTYWRVPGETGLPLEIDLAGSSGVTGHQVLWPYPTRYEDKGYLDYVYFGHTVIPLVLKTEGAAPELDASLMLGVCSDICMPARASFSLPLASPSPDRPNGLRIRQAIADVPMPWPADQPLLGEAWLAPETAVVALAVEDAELDPASLIATFDDGVPLLGPPQIGPEPEIVRFPVLDPQRVEDLEGRNVTFTFMTDDGAYETSRTIDQAAEAPHPD